MPKNTLTVGVLVPESHLFPQLGAQLLAGLRCCVERDERFAGTSVRVVSEDIGFGRALLEPAALRLLNNERADVLVGLLHSGATGDLAQLCERRGTMLLALGPGENIMRFSEPHPYCFYHTLGLWQGQWALGRWAAEQLGRRCVMALSFYDSGYDAPFAFRAGFEAAGGEIVGNLISHIPPHPWDFAPIHHQIDEAKPHFVYAAYTGQSALEFLRGYTEGGLRKTLPLIGTPALLADTLLDELGDAMLGVRSCAGWGDNIPGAAYHEFDAVFRDHSGQSTDLFALLGYEAGQLLAHGFAAAGGDLTNLHAFGFALANAVWQSPRGPIRMEPRVQSTESPVFLREIRRTSDGLRADIIDTLSGPAEVDPQLVPLRQGLRSGWINAYLSV